MGGNSQYAFESFWQFVELAVTLDAHPQLTAEITASCGVTSSKTLSFQGKSWGIFNNWVLTALCFMISMYNFAEFWRSMLPYWHGEWRYMGMWTHNKTHRLWMAASLGIKTCVHTSPTTTPCLILYLIYHKFYYRCRWSAWFIRQ